jgi:hypothetical protein
MQRSITLRVLLCACLLVLTLPMCTKTAAPGQTGATGATGSSGPQGPSGPQGSKGDTGTANVIYSSWVGGISGTSAFWSIPALTQGVYDSAAILLYTQSQFDFIYQLPFYMDLDNIVSYIYVAIQPGGVVLSCNENLNAYTFRYIIIPGGVATP